ncbi:MAG: flagellar biosynthetic protein FliO [Ferrimicrobium sp.]
MILALSLVVGIVVSLGRLARSRRSVVGLAGGFADKTLRVTQRASVGQKASVAIVTIESRRFLLGITSSQVRLVAEIAGEDPSTNDVEVLDLASAGDPEGELLSKWGSDTSLIGSVRRLLAARS